MDNMNNGVSNPSEPIKNDAFTNEPINSNNPAPNKRNKKKIVLIALCSLLVLGAVLGVSLGVHFANANTTTYNAEIVTSELKDARISLSTAIVEKGKDYVTDINLWKSMSAKEDYFLPSSVDSVISGERNLSTNEYSYNVNSDRMSAKLTIPGKYVEGAVNVKLSVQTYFTVNFKGIHCHAYNDKGEELTTLNVNRGSELTYTINEDSHRFLLPLGGDVVFLDEKGKPTTTSPHTYDPLTGIFTLAVNDNINIEAYARFDDSVKDVCAITYHYDPTINLDNEVAFKVSSTSNGEAYVGLGYDDTYVDVKGSKEFKYSFPASSEAKDYIITFAGDVDSLSLTGDMEELYLSPGNINITKVSILGDFASPTSTPHLGGTVIGDDGKPIYQDISLDIKEGVSFIPNRAFTFMYFLEEVNIPASVKTIGNNAFSGCPNITSLNFNSYDRYDPMINYIGDNAFTSAHITHLVLPESIHYIGANAFNIGWFAEETFPLSVDITRLYFDVDDPDDFIYIGDSAFGNCDTREIHINFIATFARENFKVMVDQYDTDNYWVPYKDNCFEIKHSVRLDFLLTETFREYEFSFDVRGGHLDYINWGDYEINDLTSFSYYNYEVDKVLSVYLVGDFTYLSLNRYDGIKHDYVPIAEGNTYLSYLSFGNDNNITTISKWSFAYTNLAVIEIPQNVEVIDDFAFYHCEFLLHYTVIEGISNLKRIGVSAFEGCELLIGIGSAGEGSIELCAPMLEEINDRAFYGCGCLVYLDISSSNKVVTPGVDMFEECATFLPPYHISIKVKENLLDAYKATWTQYADNIIC